MSKSFREDLTGQRFGRLTVIEFVSNDNSSISYWKCQCDCGNAIITRSSFLKTGATQSCGCLQKEFVKSLGKTKIIHGEAKREHGRTRLYRIWQNMKSRCCNPNTRNYKNYGGRGITVCDEWKDNFKVFYNWAMENGYADDLTIDRIDTNGNYESSNCRWVDMKTQQSNRRNNVIVEYQGEMLKLDRVANQIGINKYTLRSRFQKGERGEKLFRPLQKHK